MLPTNQPTNNIHDVGLPRDYNQTSCQGNLSIRLRLYLLRFDPTSPDVSYQVINVIISFFSCHDYRLIVIIKMEMNQKAIKS